MKKTIFTVVAVAGLSLFAMGQSDKKQAETKQKDAVTSPRDAASGQASGKKSGYDVKKQEGSIQEAPEASEKKNVVHRDVAARDAQSGQASGKLKTVSTDSSTPTSVKPATGQAATDHTVVAPRDSSTGMASGKRQQAPSSDGKKNDSDQPKK